jgi:hypothetical protein
MGVSPVFRSASCRSRTEGARSSTGSGLLSIGSASARPLSDEALTATSVGLFAKGAPLPAGPNQAIAARIGRPVLSGGL